MKKNTFHYIVEAGWLFLALLPLFVYLATARASGTPDTFISLMSEKLNFITTDNIIYTTIKSIFGTGGIMPVLQDGMTMYLTYFCIVEIVHLLVDVLVFIPRLAHGWLDAFVKKAS